MKVTDKPVVVEQLLNATKEQVWNAITNITEMKKWYFEMLPDFKPEVGFTTEFDVQSEGRNFHHIWEVSEVIPFKKIKYDWTFTEYSGSSYVVFELVETGNKTTLSVTSVVTSNFPENIPEFETESCCAGWEYFIKLKLKNYLEN